VVTEMTHLQDYHVYNLVRANSLTPAEHKTALESLMNIVKKHDRQVRARAVADSSKERHQPGYKKEDGTSPTVMMDSNMIAATIDAHERQDVTMVDIPGTFLHAYNNKDTAEALPNLLSRSTPPSTENTYLWKKQQSTTVHQTF
jgi:hypothetical protein